jgi:ABC-2 type transport system permease protein
VVARKEMADHVLSARFIVVLVVLALASLGAAHAAANGIRDVAPQASGIPSLFLRLFTIAIDPVPFSFFVFIGFLAPILGIAFGFDAVNGERAQGTLPRLVSQPIHRDDVINGKFVAGISVIVLALGTLVLLVAGFGIAALGIAPSLSEVARLATWLAVAVLYVSFWLAFATLCSVLLRRAASSALVAIATWLVLALFGALLVQLLAGIIAPAGSGDDAAALLHNARTEQSLARVSPVTLYDEATTALLNPETRAVGVITVAQLDRAVASNLSLSQSVLLVWPQVVGLAALTIICFAAAYVAFMRQEIRA